MDFLKVMGSVSLGSTPSGRTLATPTTGTDWEEIRTPKTFAEAIHVLLKRGCDPSIAYKTAIREYPELFAARQRRLVELAAK